MFQFPGCPSVRLWIHLTMTGHYSSRVSPFGYLRINACLRLLVAFRSLPRPSSAYGALASTLCSYSLDFYVDSPKTNLLSLPAIPRWFWNRNDLIFTNLVLPIQLSRCGGSRLRSAGELVDCSGLEPPTSRLSGECSNQLS